MCQDTGPIIMGKKGCNVITMAMTSGLSEGARDAYLRRNFR